MVSTTQSGYDIPTKTQNSFSRQKNQPATPEASHCLSLLTPPLSAADRAALQIPPNSNDRVIMMNTAGGKER